MSLLKSLDSKFFHTEIPYKPMGKYVHFITIRVTESYPLFQTDGELNKARVRAGIIDKTPINPSTTPPAFLKVIGSFKIKNEMIIARIGVMVITIDAFVADVSCNPEIKAAWLPYIVVNSNPNKSQ